MSSFSQNNYIVKTDDGRRVLLKADFTWEYIDAEPKQSETVANETPKVKTIDDTCNLASDFEEPTLDNKTQNQLKKGRATISHVKARVAKDNNCDVEQVVLISAKENKKTGVYQFCANGKSIKYKRVGNTIVKAVKVF